MRSQDVLDAGIGAWSAGMPRFFGWMQPSAASAAFDPSVIDRYFDSVSRFAERWVELNRRYVQDVAAALLSTQNAIRQHAESLSDTVNEELEATSTTVRQQADQVTQAHQDQAAATDRENRARARRVHREARDAAVQKFGEMTKPELQDELAHRELPRTGTVGELRTRLIEAELAGAAL
jgi:hypothetical protein